MTFRFEARESVGYYTVLQITSGGTPVDITGWTFKATFERLAGSPDFTLNMAGSRDPTVEGFFILNGPSGLLGINIKPATLAGIADTTGRFLMLADLLATPASGPREWIEDIEATIIAGPTS